MILFPYKNGSEGAKGLADALDIKQIKKEGSKFRGSPEKLVINWGNSMTTEEVEKCAVINNPKAVAICANKLHFFQRARQWNNDCATGEWVEIPDWFTTRNKAVDYINAGYKVVCRTVLNGHSGQGIVMAETIDQLVDAPLYVVYVPKKSEFRVHVFGGQVVDVQRKARNPAIPDDQVNWQVRNHDNGFIYVRDEQVENISRGVLTNALNAVKMVGLDFGAVDIIYNEKRNLSHVLEINTAPGLTGATLDGYKQRMEEVGKIYADIVAGKRKRKVLVEPQEDLNQAFELFRGIGERAPEPLIRRPQVPVMEQEAPVADAVPANQGRRVTREEYDQANRMRHQYAVILAANPLNATAQREYARYDQICQRYAAQLRGGAAANFMLGRR